MTKSIRVTKKKKRGRPRTTGKGMQIGERWHGPEIEQIDAWIGAVDPAMTRGEAIRRLVEIGLKAKKSKVAAKLGGPAGTIQKTAGRLGVLGLKAKAR